MEYKITPSDDGKYIVIKSKGNITRQTGVEQNLEAHALGKQLNINRYLLDVTEATNTDSTVDSYEFAYSDMRKAEGIDRTARVAALVRPDDDSHDFILTVVTNAGFNVRKFTDREQAVQFLLEGI